MQHVQYTCRRWVHLRECWYFPAFRIIDSKMYVSTRVCKFMGGCYVPLGENWWILHYGKHVLGKFTATFSDRPKNTQMFCFTSLSLFHYISGHEGWNTIVLTWNSGISRVGQAGQLPWALEGRRHQIKKKKKKNILEFNSHKEQLEVWINH